jgi:hypothetical protein
MVACAAAADLSDRHRLLFRNSISVDHEDRRDHEAQLIWKAAEPLLQRLVEMSPTSIDGHMARGAVFLAWDGDELQARAHTGGVFDRLALVVLLDLLSYGSTPR